MYKDRVKTLYSGKSKLAIDDHGANIPLGSLATDTNFNNEFLPDLVISGKLFGDKSLFLTEVIPEHNLFITGIPKNIPSLDPYRLKGCLWSSYYQDDFRGYLFQVLRINQEVQLIEIKQK